MMPTAFIFSGARASNKESWRWIHRHNVMVTRKSDGWSRDFDWQRRLFDVHLFKPTSIRVTVMDSTPKLQYERINLRLKQSAKQLLERAASFEGMTVSNFILSSALARAEKTVQQHEVMSLNAHDSEKFFNALAALIRFNRKLLAAFEEHERRVNSK